MKYKRLTYGLIITFTLNSACVDPFIPEFDTYEDVLVVDALITDDPVSHFIKLTKTSPVYAVRENGSGSYPEKPNAVTGADISLSDSQGRIFHFRESLYNQGVYTPANYFEPKIDEIYILTITTSNGKVYRSDSVVMKETPSIDSLYFKRTSIPSEKYGDLDDGFLVYVDTGTGSSESAYYKFEWEETWEFRTPYRSYLKYENNEIIPRKENTSICWMEASSADLNILTTENMSSDNVIAHPIRFISFREPTLNVKYSILVKQYALSQDGYYFWKSLEETNELTGTLYDKQPDRVTGNIRNVNDPNEPVLGYFDMATLAFQRIFIERRDITDKVILSMYSGKCGMDADTVVDRYFVPSFIRRGYLISSVVTNGYLMVISPCIDCTLKGTNVKPDYWE